MINIPTKTYPPSFVQGLIDEAAADATTTEKASGVQQGDTMSDIRTSLHASLDEAEAMLILTSEQPGGTLWPALRLMVEAIRQRDYEIHDQLKSLEATAVVRKRFENRGDTMSEIQRYTVKHGDFGGISQEPDAAGPYVRWYDHHAEVERLKATIARLTQGHDASREREREIAHGAIHRATTAGDNARREAEHLRAVINSERAQMKELRADTKEAIALLTTQRDEAQAEVERLKAENEDATSHIAALKGGATWLEAENKVAHTARRAAEARVKEIERLRQEERQTAAREQELAQGTIDRLAIERDFAQREGEKLKAEVERLTDAGNHSASLNSSRPSDEDIWRQAFFARVPYYVDAMKERYGTRAQTADLALTEYRKRWPR